MQMHNALCTLQQVKFYKDMQTKNVIDILCAIIALCVAQSVWKSTFAHRRHEK